VSCGINASPVMLNGTTASTAVVTFTDMSTPNTVGGSHSKSLAAASSLAATLCALCFALSLPPWRRGQRRQRFAPVTYSCIAVLVIGSILLSCSGGGMPTTVTITATSGNTVHTASYSLSVGP
jgi:hypothetical protein